jgi:hypothetical protein
MGEEPLYTPLSLSIPRCRAKMGTPSRVEAVLPVQILALALKPRPGIWI